MRKFNFRRAAIGAGFILLAQTAAAQLPGVTPLQSAIDAEAAARAAADNQLRTAIAGEAAVRGGMDATLLGAINDEAEARKAAIRALQESMSSDATRCYAAHFSRNSGTEMRFTVFAFNNGDLQNAVTIERLTFRAADGQIIHDSGPSIGTAHPRNLGVVPPRDITTVPPGGIYAFSTTDVWGFNGIPQIPGTDLISLQVELSTLGKRTLFQVQAREIVRDRVTLPTGQVTVGIERAANQAPCFPVERAPLP